MSKYVGIGDDTLGEYDRTMTSPTAILAAEDASVLAGDVTSDWPTTVISSSTTRGSWSFPELQIGDTIVSEEELKALKKLLEKSNPELYI